ncbi:ABC transporter substrate-binding protein [Nocardia sp. NBC_00565]|uniref:ABC transporter substrate-binding protein n=1 Tax=Nocardia sp. NBC_00565 TaxID=2975993 RepID=UPI002E819D39|nr:ABC transporter substrate-binding protein [Nocardia sp. NBC_00565]WUC05711.1 ABC transporter substrate-binding protein [Nocardia sp. NBC_00565]
MKQRKGIGAVFALGLAGLLAVSGCGSSGSDSTSSSNSSSATAPAGGSGIKAKILVVGDFTSTIPFTLPEIVPMVKGVLKDFPNVEIETCDGKGTAPGFLVCAQQAVRDRVAGVVLGFSAGGQDLSVLTKANIPTIGAGDSHSPNSYPTAEPFSIYVALGAGLAATGCTKLGIVYLDGSDFLIDYIKGGFEGKGGKEVARGSVAANAADLSPAVSKVTGAGAECVAVSLTPSGGAQALTALKQSGKTLTVGGISAVFSTELLKSLGALAEGLIVVDTVLNSSDDAPGIKDAAAAMHSVDAKAKMTQQALGSYIAAKLVAAALPKVSGEVTSASLTTALDGLRNVDMNGVIPPWSSIPVEGKTFPRIFNHYGINYKIQGGKAVKEGDFYDILALLTGK